MRREDPDQFTMETRNLYPHEVSAACEAARCVVLGREITPQGREALAFHELIPVGHRLERVEP